MCYVIISNVNMAHAYDIILDIGVGELCHGRDIVYDLNDLQTVLIYINETCAISWCQSIY